MRLLEHESKGVLAVSGIAVPRGSVVSNVEEARVAARAFGPDVVIKAQVPFGGRMKAGLIAFASGEHQAGERAAELLGRQAQDFVVEEILVEERVVFEREMFMAFSYDTAA